MEIRYDETSVLQEVEFGESTAFAQQHGHWFGYWAEQPTADEPADEIRCVCCAEEPFSCQCIR